MKLARAETSIRTVLLRATFERVFIQTLFPLELNGQRQ